MRTDLLNVINNSIEECGISMKLDEVLKDMTCPQCGQGIDIFLDYCIELSS